VSDGRFRHLGDDPVYEGYIWKVAVGRFLDPDGEEFSRDIVRSPGAVAIVAIDDSDRVVLLRHYRPSVDRVVIEIPAGMRDVPGEEPLTTAKRELREEAGLEANSWDLLHVFLPAPGMTDSTVHVFSARGLQAVPREAHGPEEEHMEVLRIHSDDVLAMVDDGRIEDAKTVIGILLACRGG
jgi:ADP-ribose pyrophosphatase